MSLNLQDRGIKKYACGCAKKFYHPQVALRRKKGKENFRAVVAGTKEHVKGQSVNNQKIQHFSR
jgi:hypothetical protein